MAESRHQLLGVVGVVANSAEVGEVSWLHVIPGSQAAHVAARLLEAALAYCREQGYLKLVLRSLRFWDDTLAEHFRRFGFEQSPTPLVILTAAGSAQRRPSRTRGAVGR